MDCLVPYSSSDDEEEVEEQQENKRRPKNTIPPKLPCALTKLGASLKKNEDAERYSNASLHNNRKRSFEHVRGNWATYVYVPVDECILEGIPEQCQSMLADVVDLQLNTDLHISLSRTVVLQYHWIDNFIRSLEKIIKCEMSFSVFLEQLEIYVNEERTRTFLGFKVHSTKLISLMHKVDVVMKEFKLPRFYEDPSFHVSFAWCLGDMYDTLTKHFERLKCDLQLSIEKCMVNAINVNELQCKIGHKIYGFKLNKFR